MLRSEFRCRISLCGFACLCSIHAPFVRADDAALRAELKNRFQARESSISSAYLELEITRDKPKGFVSQKANPIQDPALDKLGDLPGSDSHTVHIDTVLIAGERMKHTSNGPVLFPEKGQEVYTESTSTFDGQERRMLGVYPNSGIPSQVLIDKNPAIDITFVRDFSPIFWLLKPNASLLGTFHGEQPHISGTTDDHRLIEIVDGIRVFRVDPSLGYNVVSCTVSNPNGGFSTEVSYAKNENVGWVPTGWKITSSRGGVKSVTTCKVTKAEFNRPLEAKDFNVELPADVKIIRPREQKPHADLNVL